MDGDTLAAESASTSLRRSRLMFGQDPFLPPAVDPEIRQASIDRRRRFGSSSEDDAPSKRSKQAKGSQALTVVSKDGAPAGSASAGGIGSALARIDDSKPEASATKKKPSGGILVEASKRKETTIPTPKWHTPWKLSTVLSSHLGWVRSIAIDPTNQMFATGSGDRTIKLWNLPKACVGTTASDDSDGQGALMLTLTGHISPVRGLAFSSRHPYLFSAGEDKQVKCWDLETNQVVRHYHGHLSGVFCLALHPMLDILITGGRDAVARVWDIRTKKQIHCLSGHENTVGSVLVQTTSPQVITGSYDTTIRLWDLVAGKSMATLTNHQKSVRALTMPSYERTFVSGAADCLKKWQGKDGRFLRNYTGHNSVVNALAVNDDGVLVSGGDDGTMRFWDYGTGYNYQNAVSQVQPGSLDAENGIMALQFDLTGTRLITGETDKTIKIWKPDDEASELTHPVDMKAWRKKCLAEAKQRY